MNTAAPAGWLRQLRLRFLWLLWFKAVATPLVFAVVMVTYFALLRHPQFSVAVMPLTPVDGFIDFVPWAVVPYASLWLYVVLPSSLLRGRTEMCAYLGTVAGITVVAFGVFLFWPTEVPAFNLDWARWPMVAWLKSNDAGGNACPSLHVAFAVATAIWLRRLLRRASVPRWLHIVNLFWALLIVWSTMATRQHVAADVAAGALLGSVVALCMRARDSA